MSSDSPPPSSFASTFSRPSSSAGGGSSSFSTATAKALKRQSLNIVSPGAGPRPLHLASLSSTCISSNPVTGTGAPGRENGSGIHSPTPLSPTMASIKRQSNARRQSSISYIPSNTHSPSNSHFSPRRESTDFSSLGFSRSPLSGAPSPGLGRSNSAGNGRGSRTPNRHMFERSSTGSMLANGNGNEGMGEAKDGRQQVKERPPVTLAEKHADLLHFIAQKESKCLELRSQLAVHEAELLQLKRKWERIVNRGFEKALSSSPIASSSPSPSSSCPPSYANSNSMSSSSSTAHPPSTPSTSTYFPTLTPNMNSNAPGTVVLEGIKESVQGVSRLIAAGLESIGGPVSSASTADSTSTIRGPIPLRLGSSSTSARRQGHMQHGQKESQSSSTSTATSNASRSSWLSASTATSATSASATSFTESGSSTSGGTTTYTKSEVSASLDVETESEFGEFEDGHEQVQVLMVRDTGATPTMSPNPDFQRSNLRRRRSVSPSPGGARGGKAVELNGAGKHEQQKEYFNWDDGWDESVSRAQTTDDAGRSINGKTPLPGISSIPGLATMGMTPSAQQMNSWVGSVGKKWGEIRGSNTFTKNQKRASLLISDMGQSLVSALTSPPSGPASSSSSHSYTYSSTDPHYNPLSASPSSHSPSLASLSAFSTNAPPLPVPLPAPKASATASKQRREREASLLDDSDDESFGEGTGESDNITVRMRLGMGLGAPVLVPVSVTGSSALGNASGNGSATTTNAVAKAITSKTTTAAHSVNDTEEEEWNW